MKKLSAFLLVFIICLSASAQTREFRPFKVDVSYGLGVPNNSRAGILVALEPKYALNDQFAIGLRIESVNIYHNFSGSTTTDARYIRSYGLTGDYYFSKAKRRVFAGLVAGLYQDATAVVSLDKFKRLTPAVFSPAHLGFAPRLGVELGHFRAGAEYNFTLGSLSGNTSYFALKAGIVIGGGKFRLPDQPHN